MITSEKAHRVIAAGEAKAKEIGQPMNIAVVDAGTNLKAFTRMDGAWLGSIDIAINKAFTAKAFDLSTKDLGENSQPGEQFYGIQEFEPRPGHDFCRRCAAGRRWQDRRRGRRQRRQRRPGPVRSGSGRGGL